MSTDGLEQYRAIEARIKKNDFDALLARGEFGRAALEERGALKRLPDGRVKQLYHACQSSSPTVEAFNVELSRRMRLAEQYPTEAEMRALFEDKGSWYAICADGLGRRKAVAPDAPESEADDDDAAEPESDPPPRPVNDYLRKAENFEKAVETARQLADQLAPHGEMIGHRHDQIRDALARLEESLLMKETDQNSATAA